MSWLYSGRMCSYKDRIIYCYHASYIQGDVYTFLAGGAEIWSSRDVSMGKVSSGQRNDIYCRCCCHVLTSLIKASPCSYLFKSNISYTKYPNRAVGRYILYNVQPHLSIKFGIACNHSVVWAILESQGVAVPYYNIIGIAIVNVFSPYSWRFSSYFQFQSFNDFTVQHMSPLSCVANKNTTIGQNLSMFFSSSLNSRS